MFISKIKALLTNKSANNKIKAYKVIKRLKLSNTIFYIVKKAFKNKFNI